MKKGKKKGIRIELKKIKKFFASWVYADSILNHPSNRTQQESIMASLCICRYLKDDECPICSFCGGLGPEVVDFQKAYIEIRKTEREKR